MGTSPTVDDLSSSSSRPRLVKQPHISTQPFTLSNWYQHINWISTTLVVLVPLYGLVSYLPLSLRYQPIKTPKPHPSPSQTITDATLLPARHPLRPPNPPNPHLVPNLLLPNRVRHNRRLPPPVVAPLLHGAAPLTTLPRLRRRGCRARLDPVLEQQAPLAPPVDGHGARPVQRAAGVLLLAPRVDGVQAGPQVRGPHRYLGPRC